MSALKSSISVVIPSYNGARLLEECLSSLAMQSLPPVSTIVVDNGSGDDTEMVIKNAPITTEYIKLPVNVGFSKAVNTGIGQSKSELVMVLNNDVVLHQDCMFELQRAAMHNPHSSFAPLILSFDDRSCVHSAGLMFSRNGYGNRSNRYLFSKHRVEVDLFCPCGAAGLYRRAALDKVGVFNDKYFMFCEDLELGFRLQLMNYRCRFIPSALAFHHGGATAKHFLKVKAEETLKNSLITLITCVPSSWFAMDSWRIIFFYMRLIFYYCRLGYYEQTKKALTYILSCLPQLVAKRKIIQDAANYDKTYLRNLLYSGPIELNFHKLVE